MADIAIFEDDAFSVSSLTAAINEQEYLPGRISSLGLFREEGISTLTVQIEKDGETLALLLLMGLMGTVGHFLLILAFARAPASTLTPYLYTQIGFAMLCGWLVFNHIPGQLELTGIVLIVVCGATASWITAREHRLPVEPPEA